MVVVYREGSAEALSFEAYPWSPDGLLRSEKKAHFTSFRVELVTPVSVKNGRVHMDAFAGMQWNYSSLCISGNRASRAVLESIKNVIALNNSNTGSTELSIYASKSVKYNIGHSGYAPVLYAVLDSENDSTVAHFKISEKKFFDYISNKERNNTRLNIYYQSPFFYTKKILNGNYLREQITINVVLSGIELERSEIISEIEKGKSTADAEKVKVQPDLYNF